MIYVFKVKWKKIWKDDDQLESLMQIKMPDMMTHTPVPGGPPILQKKGRPVYCPLLHSL